MRIFLVILAIGLGVSGCGLKDDPLPVGQSSE